MTCNDLLGTKVRSMIALGLILSTKKTITTYGYVLYGMGSISHKRWDNLVCLAMIKKKCPTHKF